MTRLIERNTTLPTRISEIFSTVEDNQPSVEIHVLQGEREMATNNKSLGRFQITGIPPLPHGIPQIEVAFEIDANGILNVAAADLGTGKAQKVEIKAGAGLSDDEINRLAARLEARKATRQQSTAGPRPISPSKHSPRRAVKTPQVQRRPLMPIKLFYSYSHKDARFREQLQTHLTLLKRQGLIDEWHDREIGPGDEWERAIDEHLQTADVVLLLVSADFLASDYCYEREMKLALERHARGETRVLPIILRAVDWHTSPSPIGHLQALPSSGRTVVDYRKRDSAWLDVASGIRNVVTELMRDLPTDV